MRLLRTCHKLEYGPTGGGGAISPSPSVAMLRRSRFASSVFPILPSGPQAFCWFNKPIEKLKDIKGMKCRQTGIAGAPLPPLVLGGRKK